MAFNVADLQTLFSLKIEDCHTEKLEVCSNKQTEREDIVPNLFDEFSNIADTGVFQEPFSLKKYKNLIPKRSPKKKSRKLKRVDANKNTKLLSHGQIRSCSPSFSIDSAVDLSADHSLLHTQKWFADTDFDFDKQSNCDSGVCDSNSSADANMKNLNEDLQVSMSDDIDTNKYPEKSSTNEEERCNLQLGSIKTASSCEKSKLKTLNKKSMKVEPRKPKHLKNSFKKHKESYLKLLDEQKCIVSHIDEERPLNTINSLSDILLTNLNYVIPIVVEKESLNIERVEKSITMENEKSIPSNESHFTESLMNMICTPMKDKDELQNNPLLVAVAPLSLQSKDVKAPVDRTTNEFQILTTSNEILADEPISDQSSNSKSNIIHCPADNNSEKSSITNDSTGVIPEENANVPPSNIETCTELDKIATQERTNSPVKFKPRRRFIVQDDEELPSALLEILNGSPSRQELLQEDPPLVSQVHNTQTVTANENETSMVSIQTDSNSKTDHSTPIQASHSEQTVEKSATKLKQDTSTKISNNNTRTSSDSDDSLEDIKNFPQPSNDFCVNLLNFYCTGLLAKNNTSGANSSISSECSDEE